MLCTPPLSFWQELVSACSAFFKHFEFICKMGKKTGLISHFGTCTENWVDLILPVGFEVKTRRQSKTEKNLQTAPAMKTYDFDAACFDFTLMERQREQNAVRSMKSEECLPPGKEQSCDDSILD